MYVYLQNKYSSRLIFNASFQILSYTIWLLLLRLTYLVQTAGTSLLINVSTTVCVYSHPQFYTVPPIPSQTPQ